MMKKTIVFTAFMLTSIVCNAQNSAQGKLLFESKCSKCHGVKGDKGFFGATNLRRSMFSDEQYFQVIASGRNSMPSWKKKLSGEQIRSIIAYIKLFRS